MLARHLTDPCSARSRRPATEGLCAFGDRFSHSTEPSLPRGLQHGPAQPPRIAREWSETLDDAKLESRMRDWTRAEMAANEAAKAARMSPDLQADAMQSLQQQADRLRRVADAILASILEDISVHPPAVSRPPPRCAEPRRPEGS
jgi:hypothetical protein